MPIENPKNIELGKIFLAGFGRIFWKLGKYIFHAPEAGKVCYPAR